MLQIFLCLLILSFFYPRLRVFLSILFIVVYGAFHPEIYYAILFAFICVLVFYFYNKSDSKIINGSEEKIKTNKSIPNKIKNKTHRPDNTYQSFNVGKTIQELSVELNTPKNLIHERLSKLGLTPPADELISDAIIEKLVSFEHINLNENTPHKFAKDIGFPLAQVMADLRRLGMTHNAYDVMNEDIYNKLTDIYKKRVIRRDAAIKKFNHRKDLSG